ncbi:hypothetical protein C8R47DRAFT_1140803, partial [Mycena vitilis]
MPFETLEEFNKHPYFFVPGMDGPPVPNSAVLSEHPSFLLKPLIDQSKRVDWDPCAARVFAPVGWNRDEHEHETAWILKGAKPHRDGIYVNSQEKDAACLPNTKVTAKENLAGALFAQWVFCQVTHEHCLQANMLRRSKAGTFSRRTAWNIWTWAGASRRFLQTKVLWTVSCRPRPAPHSNRTTATTT